jgi:dolichol-phosphate mannosyltransferase
MPFPAKPLVIVPTYNEVSNVAILFHEVSRHAPQIHMLFVDDNSQDGTRHVIRELMGEAPGRVHILERAGKMGLGTAYVAGFRWALARDYDAIIEMDADLSHRPSDIPAMLSALGESPCAVGSRYISGGGTENWSLFRKIISRAGGIYARLILRMSVNDLTGGFNGWQRHVLTSVGLDGIRSEGYSFQIELKYRAHLAGHAITEFPILFVERRAGHSKMSSRIVLEAMLRVWHLAASRRSILAQQEALRS